MSLLALDTWALAAWLKDQPPGAAATRDLLLRRQRGEIELAINLVNWGEVFYIAARHRDLAFAGRLLEFLRPHLQLLPAPESLVLTAATLKAFHPISYADAFAAASALDLDVPLATGDPELRDLARRLPRLRLHWLGA